MSTSTTFEDLVAAGDYEGAEALLIAQRAAEDAAQAEAEQIGGGHYFMATSRVGLIRFGEDRAEYESLQASLCAALENLCDTHGTFSAAVACFERLADGQM